MQYTQIQLCYLSVFMSPSYQKSLLICTPFVAQHLCSSNLDCHLEVYDSYHGCASERDLSSSLLGHPMIMWHDETDCVDNHSLLASALTSVLQVLLVHN